MNVTLPNTLSIYKILIIGSSNVGKTSAIQRFVDKKFITESSPTIGVDFSIKSIQLTPSASSASSIPNSVVLQLWDIAGEKKYRMILPYYVNGTHGILLACDSTNPVTLVQLDDYLKILAIYLDLVHLPMILISTKHDLPTTLKQEDIQNFIQQHRIPEYLPTSSVNGLNIDIAFQHMGQLIAEQSSSK